ncbi:MAG TPA: DUF1634 domain-containing protein [Syntrophorhabdales bacterium]|nr:DUF1634 domain-containing protein [Syntrophorhabdales bacterium]
MNRRATGSGETKLEMLISYVLIGGVITSLLFVIAGMVLFYREYGNVAVSHSSQMFLRGEDFFLFFVQLFRESNSELSIRVITIGIAVLILTPYIRALLSVIYFAARENAKYLVITSFVLVLLTISLLLH